MLILRVAAHRLYSSCVRPAFSDKSGCTWDVEPTCTRQTAVNTIPCRLSSFLQGQDTNCRVPQEGSWTGSLTYVLSWTSSMLQTLPDVVCLTAQQEV
jgi:hypothetical protein